MACGGSLLATGRVSPYSPVCLNLQIFYSGEDMRSPETEKEETSELTQAVPTLSQMAQWVEVDAKLLCKPDAVTWYLPQRPHGHRKPCIGPQPWLTCQGLQEHGGHALGKHCLYDQVGHIVSLSILDRDTVLPGWLGDCDHVILLNDLCYGE